MTARQTTIQICEKLRAAVERQPRPRYISIRGGRGGGKSYQVSTLLVLRATQEPLKVLCARQYQASIEESVYTLLCDVIRRLGLESEWQIGKTHLRSSCGSSFSFIGLDKSIESIKSYEGTDICWVEEAQVIKERAWSLLTPTIRKPGSQIWLTWNPDLDSDPTWQRFVASPPSDCLEVVLSWRDNPWRSPELDQDRRDAERLRPDTYRHIWGGECRPATEGAVYGRELTLATQEKRILARIPYDSTEPVLTGWDLGHHDATSIWCAQAMGLELRLIDYLEGTGRKIADYVADLRALGYVYGRCYLPHDAQHQALNGGGSIQEMLEGFGFETEVLPRRELAPQLDRVRAAFSRLYIASEKCADGLFGIRHYAYEVRDGSNSREPRHDKHSHAADALRTLIIGTLGEEAPARARKAVMGRNYAEARSGWMAS